MMHPIQRLRRLCTRLHREDHGNAIFEGLLGVLMLCFVLVAMLHYFIAFDRKNELQKATYVIADTLSREQKAKVGGVDVPAQMTDAYMDSLSRLLTYLAKGVNPVDLRVTQIYYDTWAKKFRVSWSKTRGTLTAHTDTTINAEAARIPRLSSGEFLLIVESRTIFPRLTFVNNFLQANIHADGSVTVFNAPLPPILNQVTFSEFVPVRLRFETQLANN